MFNIKQILLKPLYHIQLGEFYFRPVLLTSIVTLLLLYVLISLGNWQTHRAEYKENLMQQLAERQHKAATDLSYLMTHSNGHGDPDYSHVYAHGEFLANKQLLLDNRVENNIPGYEVYTPLVLPNHKAILIDRGWVQQAQTRQQMPDIQFQAKAANIVDGTLLPPPAKGLVLGGYTNSYQKWPVVIQYLDINEISEHTGYDFYPYVIRMNKDQPNAYTIPAITFGLSSNRHRGYAFQWYTLALTLLIIYFAVNTKRERHD